MREANTLDLSLLVLLAVIWGSSFFNIKIATYSYDPITLALVRVIFASIPLLILFKVSGITIEDFGKRLLFTTSFTAVIWLLTLFFTEPESEETLNKFVMQVKPPRTWLEKNKEKSEYQSS